MAINLPGDIMPSNSTLEIKPLNIITNLNGTNYNKTNNNFYIIDYFGSNGLISIDVDFNLFGLIEILNEVKNWILILI